MFACLCASWSSPGVAPPGGDSHEPDCKSAYKTAAARILPISALHQLGVRLICHMRRYAALAAFMNSSSNDFSVAAIQNRGMAFVSPYNSVFPFYSNELPPSIASPAWQDLSLSTTGALRVRAKGRRSQQEKGWICWITPWLQRYRCM